MKYKVSDLVYYVPRPLTFLSFLCCFVSNSYSQVIKYNNPDKKQIEVTEFKAKKSFIDYPDFSKKEENVIEKKKEHFTDEEAVIANEIRKRKEAEDLKELHSERKIEKLDTPKTTQINFSMPLEKFKITSHFGTRKHPVLHTIKNHRGLDLRANFERVYSMFNGIVSKVAEDKTSGKYIEIKYQNYILKYLHLSSIYVFEDEQVNAGSIIAISGDSGAVTAPHLHLEVLRNGVHIDPTEFLINILQIINNYE